MACKNYTRDGQSALLFDSNVKAAEHFQSLLTQSLRTVWPNFDNFHGQVWSGSILVAVAKPRFYNFL